MEVDWYHNTTIPPNCTLSVGAEEAIRVHTKFKGLYMGLTAVSISASMFIFISVFTNKKLTTHPSVMIGYIALFEALSAYHVMIWMVSPMHFIDYFGLRYLFKYIVTLGYLIDIRDT